MIHCTYSATFLKGAVYNVIDNIVAIYLCYADLYSQFIKYMKYTITNTCKNNIDSSGWCLLS